MPCLRAGQVSLRNWLLFVLLELASTHLSIVAWEREGGTDWSLVSAANKELLNGGGQTFVRAPKTLVTGDILVAGSSNVLPDLEACAASCAAVPECTAFNFCPQGGCPLDVALMPKVLPVGGCELRHQEMTVYGLGVFQLASGGNSLGDAGVKVLVERPEQIPEGYHLFLSQLMRGVYDMHCPESQVPNMCIILGSLEEVAAKCGTLPDCYGFVFGPRGRGNLTQPFGALKFPRDGDRLDPSQGVVNPTAYLLVKEGRVGHSAAAGLDIYRHDRAEGDGGLAGGAVAGIVVGAVAGCAALGVAAVCAVGRRAARRSRGPAILPGRSSSSRTRSTKDSKGSKEDPALPPLVVRRLREEEDGAGGPGQHGQGAAPPHDTPLATPSASPTRILASKLFIDTPNVQWADLVVPRSQIKFCTLPDGSLARLGGGASGNVYKVVLGGHTVCACKVFDFEQDTAQPEHFIQEALLLRQINHPSIVQFYGVSLTERQGLLLMELMAGRDLARSMHTLARGSRGRLFGWYNKGHRVAQSIASALAYLHEHGVVHMDVKDRNVLLTRDGTAKLGDVGFSRTMRNNQVSNLVEGRIGTWDWCAPEVLLGTPNVGAKSDIFSFGVLLAELVTGEEPRRGHMPALVAPAQCPLEIVGLQARCMALDPAQRPTAAEIVDILRSLTPSTPAPPRLPCPCPLPPPWPPQPRGFAAGIAAAAAVAAAAHPGAADGALEVAGPAVHPAAAGAAEAGAAAMPWVPQVAAPGPANSPITAPAAMVVTASVVVECGEEPSPPCSPFQLVQPLGLGPLPGAEGASTGSMAVGPATPTGAARSLEGFTGLGSAAFGSVEWSSSLEYTSSDGGRQVRALTAVADGLSAHVELERLQQGEGEPSCFSRPFGPATSPRADQPSLPPWAPGSPPGPPQGLHASHSAPTLQQATAQAASGGAACKPAPPPLPATRAASDPCNHGAASAGLSSPKEQEEQVYCTALAFLGV